MLNIPFEIIYLLSFLLQNLQLDNEGNGYGSNAKHAKADKSGSGTDLSMVNRRSPLNLGNLKSYGKFLI